MDFRNKHVLIFGLGILGGGVATTNWFLKQGAKVTITDLKTEAELAPSLAQIEGNVALSLGGHKLADIEAADVIVLNPAVSVNDPLIQQAMKLGKKVVNEAVIFYENFSGKMIGITGTRGKTTTATWTAHLLGDRAILAGNSPDHPFLSALSLILKGESERVWAVTEMSSFSLELFDEHVRAPDIAVVTNIYQDHLNRYSSIEEYANTKKNLYRWQKPPQILIDNTEDVPLELGNFETAWGKHNVANVRLAALAAHHAGISWSDIQTRLATLPQIPFRQEVIFKNDNLTIINDTAATSPEGGIAALERFGGPDTVLIAGGTDRELDFAKWTEVVEKTIPENHRVFLAGSATEKFKVLGLKFKEFGTLEECLTTALALKPKIILFSPACKSFEKFKNEFDRGAQFNKLVKTLISSHKYG